MLPSLLPLALTPTPCILRLCLMYLSFRYFLAVVIISVLHPGEILAANYRFCVACVTRCALSLFPQRV